MKDVAKNMPVVIMGQTFTVGTDLPSQFGPESISDPCALSDGSMCLADQHIAVREDMPEEQRQITLLHEVIEAINEMCDLRLNHTQISTLAVILWGVILENPLGFNE